MDQLILHLVGDYWLQTDRMAKLKQKQWRWALGHAVTYALPFLLLQPAVSAWLVIFLSHAVIDRFGLARYGVFAKNWLTDRSLTWQDCSTTGYPQATPLWLAVWLTIAADNALHLAINYAALRWL